MSLAPQSGPRAGVAVAEKSGGVLHLRLEGEWDVHAASRLDAEVGRALARGGRSVVVFDGAGLATLDTAGAWVVAHRAQALSQAGRDVRLEGFSDSYRALYDRVAAIEGEPRERRPRRRPNLLAPVEALGGIVTARARSFLGLTAFFGLVLVRFAALLIHPRRLRPVSVVHHVETAGLNALPIVGLLSFLIGVVLAYQGADQLRQFGAEIFVVDLLGISILRELGGLLTAIIVAGRSGSAFTAQIGTMMVNQEVDAMKTMGLDPVDRLVLPRVVGLVVSLPLLTFYASILGLVGGGLMAWVELGIHPSAFVRQLRAAVDLEQLAVGLIKAPFFAVTIAIVGCFQGFQVTGSAESVGRLTTVSVVQSIFLVIIADAAFSVVFARIGI